MKFKTDNVPFQCSCLQGQIDVSFALLVATFGKPNCKNDGYKTDAQWRLLFEDGTYATIYNYKDGKNYCGRSGLPVSKITDWHIGGNSSAAVTAVCQALGKAEA